MAKVGKVLNMAGEVISEGFEVGAKKVHNIKNATEILGTRAPKVRRELDWLRRGIEMDNLEEAFNRGITLGSKNNNIIVDKASPLVNKYEKELAKNPNNQKAALKNTTRVGKDPDKIFNIEQENRTRQEILDKYKKRAETTKNRVEQSEQKWNNYGKKAHEETVRTRKEIEDAFSSGAEIGDGLIVPQNGNIHKQYNDLTKNKGFSNEEAVNKINKQLNAKDPDKIFNIEEENKARQEIIDKHRKRAETTRKNIEQREQQWNYTNELKGKKPDVDNIISTRDLKKNMYDNKESYMKWSQAKKYDEAIDAFKKGEYNHPLLEQLSEDVTDIKQLSVDNLQALRQNAINNASAKDMKMMDTLGYYQVPQKVTGVLGTAWLVNKMAATGGEQTNSQLYGQSPY